ncbi:MAG TPA: ComF family protein [Patescibacteria group bacterium]|nr:ComF family protein [Patescibacteria group bacterium]
MKLLDIIFPKKCVNCRRFGEYVCHNCIVKIEYSDNYSCPVCLRPSINGMTHNGCLKRGGIDGVVSITNYNNIVKKLIFRLKYPPYIKALAVIISKVLIEGLIQNESFYKFLEEYNPVIIPIPLSEKRLRTRGYNHAELIGYYVAQYFGLKLNTDLLQRIKDTKPQYKLNKIERFENLKNAFEITNIYKKSKNLSVAKRIPESVILIDDIATSFATLKAASSVLKKNGVKRVLGVTFAREI